MAMQEALKSLAAAVPDDVHIFHWSDIDPDGAWIFRTTPKLGVTKHAVGLTNTKRIGPPKTGTAS